jgi:Fic family protein
VTSARAGRFELQPGGYRASIPAPLPPPDLRLEDRIQRLLSDADLALGRLDGAAAVVPDADMFVLMYVRREAVLSSQIEGTEASLMDVLEYEAGLERSEARVDVAEIVNHIAAMNHGLNRLAELPLSRRLICEVHRVLMENVRGGEPHRTPGEFRRSQNWIGGASPDTARFVPPPPDRVDDAFSDLERFLHDPGALPTLVAAGLAHAQFETIHPFLDGNGRTGRLLITFWLVERGVLRRPLLYPSLFFKEHRDAYYDRLQAIREDGGWEDWLAFFLEGIATVATEATGTATKILELRERDRSRIATTLGRRAVSAMRLLDELFKRPVVTAKTAQDIVGLSQPAASSLVNALEREGILEERTGRKRHRVFAYREYLDLFPGATSRT